MSLLDVCRRTARRTFGIERLRPEQEAAMVAILQGRDALAAIPTGFGKSLIYQVPAMILKRPAIVVSPLIAPMADQERALRSYDIPVLLLHSDCVQTDVARRPHSASAGRFCRWLHGAGNPDGLLVNFETLLVQVEVFCDHMRKRGK